MSCLECLQEKKKIDCRKCDVEFAKRELHFDNEEEEKEDMEFFKGVITVGVAVVIVAVISSCIYWWAGK